jgi:elongation factor G
MSARDLSTIRNVGIISHGGAGKTSLTEGLLFTAGAIARLGKVDEGNTVMDFDAEEMHRKVSISTGVGHLEHRGHLVNLLDTPGYRNFLSDTHASLRIAGGAVVLVSGISGVKAETERVWGFADEYELPRLVFVNKLDRERADLGRALHDVEEIFAATPLPLFIPIGREQSLAGVYNLITQKGTRGVNGKSEPIPDGDIPTDVKADAATAREKLLEAVCEMDDDLLERYLEGEEPDAETLRVHLREATLTGRIIPVVCGSATTGIGVHELLDAIIDYLPSPLDKAHITRIAGTVPDSDEVAEREPDPAGPVSAQVFKTLIDPYAGKLSYLRVYSGTIKADDHLLNANTGQDERLHSLNRLQGKDLIPVPALQAGEIGVTTKLKDTHTGDTLCARNAPIRFAPITYPAPQITYAIEPADRASEDKLSDALGKLMEEDPVLKVRIDPQTHETLLEGMGQVHLEVVVARLKNRFGASVELKAPKVPYLETITKAVRVQGKYKKQTGGRGQYGDVWLEVSPMPRGSGFVFEEHVVGGVVPRQYIPAVEKGIGEALVSGCVAGYPVVDCKADLVDGSHHSVDSSEMAFKVAGSMAWKKAMEQAGPILLEPHVAMEITVPDESTGDVISDLNSRRGRVLGVEPKAASQIIQAEVPMVEVLEYGSTLRQITSGRGLFSMHIERYEELPAYLKDRLLASLAKERDEK